jgi:predicted Zn finger-like uncharacterized protein
MSLATRCIACGTVFRVVQDQLKVSEGWVRCGRCNEVFNALDGLFDLERDAAREGLSVSSAQVEAVVSPIEAPARTPPAEAGFEHRDQPLGEKIDAQLKGSRESGHDFRPASRVDARDRLEFPDAQFDSDLSADDMVVMSSTTAEMPLVREQSADQAGAHPDFVKSAQRAALWNTPRFRFLQAVAAVALSVLLLLQTGHQFRDQMSATWPAVKPALVAWCRIAACAVQAPRRIDDIAVESTALTRAAAADAFKLSVLLRNRGTTELLLPSIDLSLTDSTGRLIARRMFRSNEFLAEPMLVAAGADSALQVVLTAGTERVAGYTVEVFYP